MSRNKETYPYPLEFRPERFLGPSPHSDPRKFIFGFRRRLHLVEGSLYLNISCTLAIFTIVKPLDERGKDHTSRIRKYWFSLVSRPSEPKIFSYTLEGTLNKPFKCRFIPRNRDLLVTLAIIRTSAESINPHGSVCS
ncbi:hypothetical protein BD769DRAFT_1343703 [Suillus cothurnatus]|nr:hypothetical protein BD769DRAFT_1343703 [Suillus cothurnatus]